MKTKTEVKHTPTVVAFGPIKMQGEGHDKREFVHFEFGPADGLTGELYMDTINYEKKIEAIRRVVNAHDELVAAAELVNPAMESLMDEIAEKKAADWDVINDCLVKIGRALAKAEGR